MHHARIVLATVEEVQVYNNTCTLSLFCCFSVAVATDAEPRTYKSGSLSLGQFSVIYIFKIKIRGRGLAQWQSCQPECKRTRV